MNNKKSHQQEDCITGISRRDFLRLSSLLGALLVSCPATAVAELRERTAETVSAQLWKTQATWRTIAQVQEVLLPSGENTPGANDIAATDYLYKAIENPNADGDDKDFIFRGVGWLDDLVKEKKNKTFLQLNALEQEEMITTIVGSRAGRNWVSTLLSYTIEALLTDPVYGGNKNRIGWAWLEHQPGYPSPPADKTWDLLLQKRYKAEA